MVVSRLGRHFGSSWYATDAKNNEPKEHHVTSGRNKLVLCVSSKLSQKFYQFSFSTQTASRGRKVTHFHDGGQEAPSQIDCVFFYYTPKIKQTKETERSPEPGQTRQLRFGPLAAATVQETPCFMFFFFPVVIISILCCRRNHTPSKRYRKCERQENEKPQARFDSQLNKH